MKYQFSKIKPKNTWVGLAIGLVVLLVLIAVVGVATNGNSDLEPKPIARIDSDDGVLKGFGYSPKSSDSDELEFFDTLQDNAEAVVWSGDWTLIDDSALEAVPHRIMRLAAQKKFTPLIILDESKINSSNIKTRLKELHDFVLEYRPKYIGIGRNSTAFYEKDRQSYRDFVVYFDAAYDSVKSASPDTKVFTVLDYEYVAGLSSEEPNWEILSDFPHVDLWAFESFPGQKIKDPGLIDAEYYEQVREHTDKDVIFSAIGWHASSQKGFESSEAEQAQFVTTFFSLTKNLRPKLVSWGQLYDQDDEKTFKQSGLISPKGVERVAFSVWREAGYFDQ